LSPDQALGAAFAVDQAWSGSFSVSGTNAATSAGFLGTDDVATFRMQNLATVKSGKSLA
jgi:hypothetical protein